MTTNTNKTNKTTETNNNKNTTTNTNTNTNTNTEKTMPKTITKRNRASVANALSARFPLAGGLDAVLALIENAKTPIEAEAAIEDAIDNADKRSGSVVPQTYKNKYAALGHPSNCGDDFALSFEAAVSMVSKGRVVLDIAALTAIAENNSISMDRYDRLNNGMKRMNVGNKLRNRVKKGERIWWPTKTSFSK